MDRRLFLSASLGLIATGCYRDRARQQAQSEAEMQALLRARLDRRTGFEVPAGSVRTTPPPPINVLEAAPELKPLMKAAVRLHPRASTEPKVDESKLGGTFLWPANEPWPTCSAHQAPMVAGLQLELDQAPPNWPSRPGTDLFQLFYCPHDWTEAPKLVWRRRNEVSATTEPPADLNLANPSVPLPCRLFPEKVLELPPWDVIPQAVRAKLEAWKPTQTIPGRTWGAEAYQELLSVASGTKLGGYAGVHAKDPPSCPTCKWGMDHILTLASDEWTDAGAARWQPTEERGRSDVTGYRQAAGWTLPNGRVGLFLCRRCEAWPARFAPG